MSLPSRLSVWSASSSPGTAGSGICFTQTTMFMRCSESEGVAARRADAGRAADDRDACRIGAARVETCRYRRPPWPRPAASTCSSSGPGPAGIAAGDRGPPPRARRRSCVDKARFPRDKTCGDGLTTGALRLLETLGARRPHARRRTRRSTRPCSSSPSGREVDAAAPPRRRVRRRRAPRRARRRARRPRARAGASTCARARPSTDVVARRRRRRTRDARRRHRARPRARSIAADGHYSAGAPPAREPDAPPTSATWHAFRQYFTGVDDRRLWVLFEEDLLPGYAWVFPLRRRARQRRLRRAARPTARRAARRSPRCGATLARPAEHPRASSGPTPSPRARVRGVADPRRRTTATALTARPRAVRRRRRRRRRPDDRRGHRAGARDRHARGRARSPRRRGDPARRRGALPRRRRPRARRATCASRPLLQRVLRHPLGARAAIARRRPHAVDPPQLRPLDVRGLSPRPPAHAPPLAPQACSTGRAPTPYTRRWPSLTTGSRPRTGRPTSRSTPPTPGSTRSPSTATSCCATSPTRSPSPSTSASSTWTGRAAATPTSRPIATADGELDCRGFWKQGDERPDKGGALHDERASSARRIVAEVESVGADFGRVRVDQARAAGLRRRAPPDPPRRQQPLQPRRPTVGSCARGSSSPTTPTASWSSWSRAPTACPTPPPRCASRCTAARGSSSTRSGSGTSCATPATEPRYALISSFESGPALEAWIASQT